MDLKHFRTDLDKAKNGVWVNVDPDGDVKIKVARMNNSEYQAYLSELLGVSGRRITGGTLRRMQDQKTRSEAVRKALARHVLLDWKGFTDNGEEVPYSEKKALELLTDPAYQDFYDLVLQSASDEDLFREEEEEEDAGNSSSA